jgi:hypothetical protein
MIIHSSNIAQTNIDLVIFADFTINTTENIVYAPTAASAT